MQSMLVGENRWIDEIIVFMWIEKGVGPYVHDVPKGFTSIMLLDFYCYYMLLSVVEAIQDGSEGQTYVWLKYHTYE